MGPHGHPAGTELAGYAASLAFRLNCKAENWSQHQYVVPTSLQYNSVEEVDAALLDGIDSRYPWTAWSRTRGMFRRRARLAWTCRAYVATVAKRAHKVCTCV